MNGKSGSFITSKWVKTEALLRNEEMRSYVPETQRMSKEVIRLMIKRYAMVYIKPEIGTYGKGVMRVEQIEGKTGGLYHYQLGSKKRKFSSFDSMYQSILEHKSKGSYLVQQGIRVLKHKGRPFDVRVMVQRNGNGKWEATGIISRVAHPKKIVTNYHNGGTPKELRPLLKPYLGLSQATEYERILAKVGERAASALSKSYPHINMVGADIGIDSKYKPWIIELNTKPDPFIFRHLKDRGVLRKVLRYYRAIRNPHQVLAAQ